MPRQSRTFQRSGGKSASLSIEKLLQELAGRVTASWYPTIGTTSNALSFSLGYDDQPPTRTAYDVLDRPVLTTFPDATTLSTAHTIGGDTAGVDRLLATTTDPEGKIKKTLRGTRELVTAVQEFDAGSALTTRYAHDGVGQLTDVWDAEDNHTQVTYDLIGRRLSVDNPDAGTVEQLHDGAGNLVRRITPNLRADNLAIGLDYAYDRLSGLRCPERWNNNVVYRYGPASARGEPGNRVGRLTSIRDGSGTLQRAYGKLGEVTDEVRTVSPDVAVHAATFETRYVQDTWGRLRSIAYPDGEQVVYAYDSGGQVSSAVGTRVADGGDGERVHVARLEYDEFGQPAFMQLGNGVQTTYACEPAMRRLSRLTSGPKGKPAFQDLAYGYYPSGNIQSLTNNVPVPQVGFGGHVSQGFTYDDPYRLHTAKGDFTGRLGGERNSLTMNYDSIHNISRKDQDHTVQRSGGPAQVQRKTTYDWTYHCDGPRPHVPTSVGDRTFSWDANGNLIGWQSTRSSQRRVIAWDEENRVRTVSDNGKTTRFAYDASSDRVIKAGVRGETIYANGYFMTQDGGQSTKHVYVGTTRIASIVEPGIRDMLYMSDEFPGQGIYHWSSVAAEHAQNPYHNWHLMAEALGVREEFIYFDHPDHLGSTAYVTDEEARIYEHLEYFPFGEIWLEELKLKSADPRIMRHPSQYRPGDPALRRDWPSQSGR